MKKILTTLLISAILIGCTLNQKAIHENELNEKHEKYRTLMYRSNFKQCFVDSCRKYGLLYDSAIGLNESYYVNALDTIPFKGEVVCN